MPINFWMNMVVQVRKHFQSILFFPRCILDIQNVELLNVHVQTKWAMHSPNNALLKKKTPLPFWSGDRPGTHSSPSETAKEDSSHHSQLSLQCSLMPSSMLSSLDGLSPDHCADKEEERKTLLGAYSAFIPQQNILFRAVMNLPRAGRFSVGSASQI